MAELAWLDGIVAYAAADPPGLGRARDRLEAVGGKHADVLRASLRAFERHATGDHDRAGRELAELEWELAEHEHRSDARSGHPYLSAIHRVAAARWALEAGDTLRANRLLTWHEAVFGGLAKAADQVVTPIALHERARIAEAWGRWPEARDHYRGFLDRYDRPPRPHAHLLEDAVSALSRLPGLGSGPDRRLHPPDEGLRRQ